MLTLNIKLATFSYLTHSQRHSIYKTPLKLSTYFVSNTIPTATFPRTFWKDSGFIVFLCTYGILTTVSPVIPYIILWPNKMTTYFFIKRDKWQDMKVTNFYLSIVFNQIWLEIFYFVNNQFLKFPAQLTAAEYATLFTFGYCGEY